MSDHLWSNGSASMSEIQKKGGEKSSNQMIFRLPELLLIYLGCHPSVLFENTAKIAPGMVLHGTGETVLDIKTMWICPIRPDIISGMGIQVGSSSEDIRLMGRFRIRDDRIIQG